MEKALQEYKLLKKKYFKVEYYLDFKTPFQLVVGTILSAQCTDERANMVLNDLFKKHKKPEDFVKLRQSVLEKEIRSAGFYKNKAKSIKGCAKLLLEKYNGRLPKDINELVKFPGIGRKTANAILQNAFGIVEGVVVDTHVIRLAQRLGWSKHKNPVKIEKDLMEIFPKRDWKSIPHILKAHGRNVCKAPIPICSGCVINKLCPRIGVKKSK